MIILLDTTAYSHLVRGNGQVAKAVKNADRILLPSFVVAELRYGFMHGAKTTENDRLLARFLASKKVELVLPDNATTDYFVDIAAHARKKGVRLSMHDIWIASLAEEWSATLMTFDNDFAHLMLPSLKLELIETE